VYHLSKEDGLGTMPVDGTLRGRTTSIQGKRKIKKRKEKKKEKSLNFTLSRNNRRGYGHIP
jgi:hypothetical protein